MQPGEWLSWEGNEALKDLIDIGTDSGMDVESALVSAEGCFFSDVPSHYFFWGEMIG